MATSQEKGGFECEFVEKPPEKFLQLECPVCLLILRDPCQASCCGNSFCRSCIQRIEDDYMPCPICKDEEFYIFADKRLRRSLNGLEVYCSHKQEGCEWKGELGQLDDHLNLSPQPDKQLEGCKYSKIECIYCSELMKRPYIADHQNCCPKRPFSCEYCHSYKSHYEDVINNHWLVCGYQTVQCPNECGTTLLRQALENHVTRDCPKTVIDCDFHHFGCDVKLPRKDMQAHLDENLVTHMSLQAASYSKLLASYKELQTNYYDLQGKFYSYEKKTEERLNKLEQHNEALVQTNKTQERKITRLLQETYRRSTPHGGVFIPCELVMENFEQHKEADDMWTSRPFYALPRGYRFCLMVHANGVGNAHGTHVSIYLRLLKGEFDDELLWPFKGMLTILLIDQSGANQHHVRLIKYDENTPSNVTSRVFDNDVRDNEWGFNEYISHSQITPSYRTDDQLCFRMKVTLAA